jgi:UDP-glucose 4-epimerase
MEKILITGGAGFIASHISRRFLSEGYRVVGVDDLSTGLIEAIPDGVEFIQGDLALPATIAKLPKNCRKILHLAGQSSGEISFDDPVTDLQKNTITTINLIKYGIQNKIERFVYASSMSVYGAVPDAPISEDHECKPLSCYGIGKRASEDYLRIYQDKIPSISMRMFNVYGPGQNLSNLRQGMVSIYLAQALAKGLIEVKGGGDRFRDFIYIDDVVEAWFRASTFQSAIGKTLNIGTGIKTTVSSLLDNVCEIVPNSHYFITEKTQGDQAGIYANTASLFVAIQMDKFTPLKVGLKKFADWATTQKL